MRFVQMLFPEGKRRAFTMSYDDGVTQDRRLVEMMNRYGIRGTFNLNSGFLGMNEIMEIDGFQTDVSKIDESEVASLYKNHEVANHGMTHLKVTEVGREVVAYQIIEDRKKLEGLTKQICTGFAYPFGNYDELSINTLKNCGITYARTVNSTGDFGIPDNFLTWNPTCHHNDENLFLYAKQLCEDDTRRHEARLFYLWGHSYEFDQRDNWERIEELLKYLSQYKETIWFATNGEIYHYVQAFKKLEYSVDGSMIYNPTAKDLYLAIDGEEIKIPAGEQIIL